MPCVEFISESPSKFAEGGGGGGSYIIHSAVDQTKEVSDKEGDGYVIVRLHIESDGLFS